MLRRPRRNRQSAAIRGMAQETHLTVDHLVQPIFLVDGQKIKTEVSSLPGNYRMSIDMVLKEVEDCLKLGLHNFIMFPAVDEALKDKIASYSYHEDNFYLHAARKLKERFPEIALISDVAMATMAT